MATKEKTRKEKGAGKARKAPALRVNLDRSALEDTLKVAQDFVEKGGRMPILGHVLLSADEKTCTITATDIERSWKRTIGAESKAEVKRCIPANLFYKEVKALHPELNTVEVAFTENAVSVNGRCEIFTLPAEDFPAIPTVEGLETDIEELTARLKKVVVASADSDTRYVLNTVCIDLGKGYIVATDGHRLHFEHIPAVKDGKMILVPARTAVLACKHSASSVVTIGDRIRMSLAGGEMVSSLVEGTYPNFMEVIPRKSPVRISFSSEEFLRIIEGALPLSSGESKAVKLTANGTLVVESSHPDIGHYKWQIPCKTDGADGKFAVKFNAGYLVDALKAFPMEEAALGCTENMAPCLINDRAVVMPMR